MEEEKLVVREDVVEEDVMEENVVVVEEVLGLLLCVDLGLAARD